MGATSLQIQPAGIEWAYPVIEADFKAGADVWREVSKSFYWQALEVLPPIYTTGGFMVGEAWSHDAEGYPIYALFATVGGKFYARVCAVRDAATACQMLRHTLSRPTVTANSQPEALMYAHADHGTDAAVWVAREGSTHVRLVSPATPKEGNQ